MLKKLSLFASMVVALALFLGAAPAAPAAEFYEGKTIRFVVGFAAGGGFDTYTRMIARHFGKHVPGNPSTVVENMTGAGSLVAANYIYNRADADGVCALTAASGIKTPEDWLNSKRPVKIGATAPGSTTDDVPKLVGEALGLPIQMIEGFKGTARIRLAAEAGEVDGGCWAWQSIKPTWAKGLESGNVRPVLQTMLESHPELEHVPLAVKYAKTEEARELLKIANGPYGILARPYSVPPKTPKDRLEILQKAFMATAKDPELLAESKKAKLEFTPTDGPTVAKLVAELYDLKPDVKEKLKKIILPKK
jgi:tripartite-type tricarboxylate transporter receptor subunit TctC